MQSLMDFFYMGGYAAYLWPAYALTGAVLFANWQAARRRRRRVLQRLAALQES